MLRLRSRVKQRLRRWKQDRRLDAYDRAWRDMRVAQDQVAWLRGRRYMGDARRIFSIGPGAGRAEIDLLRGSQIRFGYAEPHSRMRRALERNARRAGVDSLIDERHSGYEPQDLVGAYDVVLSINSWYAWGPDDRILSDTRALLEPDGVLVILLWSRTDFFAENGMTLSGLFAEDFSRWLSDNGVEHSTHRLHQSVPMSLLVRDGQPTRTGTDVIKWFAGSPYAGPDARSRYRNTLLSRDTASFERVHDVFEITPASAHRHT